MPTMFIRNRFVISSVLFGFILTTGMLKLLSIHFNYYSDTNDRLLPIIFVGGFPSSGTTLMRVLLDSHPEIRCGQETHVIPKLLLHIGQYNLREKTRLDAAGVTEKVLDSAVASFILQIIKNHGKPARRLCNKDPLSLRNMTYLVKLFPNAKFVLMIRDGRAVVHSMISRKITIRGIKNYSFEHLLNTWSETVWNMARQCTSLVPIQCIFVRYEDLVLFPGHTMKRVIQFVGVDWNDRVLHHERHIGTPMGPVVSRLEKSSDQVTQAIYERSLYKWIDVLPQTVKRSINKLAPVLTDLGYETNSDQPDYSKLNVLVGVINKTLLLTEKGN